MLAAIEAEGRVVDALVNNAGYGLPGAYAQTSWADQSAFLQVLLVSVCGLTHKVLPGMIERGFGRIVNVASLAGLAPGAAGHTLYAATKSFLVKFSQSLHLETQERRRPRLGPVPRLHLFGIPRRQRHPRPGQPVTACVAVAGRRRGGRRRLRSRRGQPGRLRAGLAQQGHRRAGQAGARRLGPGADGQPGVAVPEGVSGF